MAARDDIHESRGKEVRRRRACRSVWNKRHRTPPKLCSDSSIASRTLGSGSKIPSTYAPRQRQIIRLARNRETERHAMAVAGVIPRVGHRVAVVNGLLAAVAIAHANVVGRLQFFPTSRTHVTELGRATLDDNLADDGKPARVEPLRDAVKPALDALAAIALGGQDACRIAQEAGLHRGRIVAALLEPVGIDESGRIVLGVIQDCSQECVFVGHGALPVFVVDAPRTRDGRVGFIPSSDSPAALHFERYAHVRMSGCKGARRSHTTRSLTCRQRLRIWPYRICW